MEKYGFEVFVIIIIWVGILGVLIGNYLDAKVAKVEDKPIEKACPPHMWDWEQQLGAEEEVFYIRCKRCRRLPGWDKEEV